MEDRYILINETDALSFVAKGPDLHCIAQIIVIRKFYWGASIVSSFRFIECSEVD